MISTAVGTSAGMAVDRKDESDSSIQGLAKHVTLLAVWAILLKCDISGEPLESHLGNFYMVNCKKIQYYHYSEVNR